LRDHCIDKLVDGLTRRVCNEFGHVYIPEGAVVYKQMHPETKFLCIHGYATTMLPFGLPQDESDAMKLIDEDRKYLCVTIISKSNNSGAVVTPETTKCYVRSSKVTAWMTKSAVNKKKIIMRKDAKMQHQTK